MTRRWCIPPRACAAFVAAMEPLLDLYSLPPDPLRPLVCMDEFSRQLVSEVAPPVPTAPGSDAKVDAEYVREGSASAFMIAAPHLGVREVFVGREGRRTARDFAEAVRFLCDEMFPDAEEIQLVMDNLNTHTPASLYRHFPPGEARRLASRLRIRYTPKHGSWLNIAELEISALKRSLPERIPDIDRYRRHLSAATARRNMEPTPVRWSFTTADARKKMPNTYPDYPGKPE